MAVAEVQGAAWRTREIQLRWEGNPLVRVKVRPDWPAVNTSGVIPESDVLVANGINVQAPP